MPGRHIHTAALLCACLAAARAPAQLPGPLGNNQPVAVVVARYQNSAPNVLSSAQVAAALNLHVNAYYLAATAGQTSFTFTAVPGVLALPFADDAPTLPDPINYANSVFREGQAAVTFAENSGVSFATTTRLILVTNTVRRGNSTIGHWPIYRTNLSPFTPISLAVFGEVDAAGAMLFNPATVATDALAATNLSVAAHELGHQLGQFDLYNYLPQPEFIGFWSMMGADNFQNFDSFTRRLMGWLPDATATQVSNVFPPFLNAIDQQIVVAPTLANGTLPELVQISFKPANPLTGQPLAPFSGIYLEARVRQGLDNNLPADYEEGVLISLVNEGLPTASFVVQPRPGEIVGPRATINPANGQNSFGIGDLGLMVTCLNRAGNNFRVRIQWAPPPRPDVMLDPGLLFGESRDIWIDSPSNGFGTFLLGPPAGDTAPLLYGDLPFVPYVIPWTDPDGPGWLPALPGLPVPAPVNHRIQIRARNIGNAAAANVVGRVMILSPTIPNVDLTQPQQILALATPQQVNFGNIAAGGQSIRSVNYSPDGSPFMVICLLDKVDTEINLFNQLAGEAFIIFQPAPGSPYDPVPVSLSVVNLDYQSKLRLLAAVPTGVPLRWTGEQDQQSEAVEPGRHALFKLVLRAPERDKPQMVTPHLVAWADWGDSFKPIGELPLYVDLSVRTTTELQVKFDGKTANFSGRVTPGHAGLPVSIAVTGNDGSLRWVGGQGNDFAVVTTGQNGSFTGALQGKADVSYSAVASFGGTPEMKPSQSAPVAFGKELPQSGGGRPGIRLPGPIRELPIRPRIQIETLPRPLSRSFQEATPEQPVTSSIEPLADGAAVDWTAGRIYADGFGPRQPNLPIGVQRAAQRRVALLDAYRNLAESSQGVRVTSETEVRNYELVSDVIKTRLDAVLKDFQIVDEGVDQDGTYHVTIASRLGGPNSMAQVVLPQVQSLEPKARESAASLRPGDPRAPQPRTVDMPEDLPAPTDWPPQKEGPYTGLIVDCRGLDISRAMAPKILMPDESEVWGTVNVSPDFVLETGLVSYLPSLKLALDSAQSRAGTNPLLVRAIGRHGSFKANAVVSAEDGAAIQKENERMKFLDNFRIVFVLDP